MESAWFYQAVKYTPEGMRIEKNRGSSMLHLSSYIYKHEKASIFLLSSFGLL